MTRPSACPRTIFALSAALLATPLEALADRRPLVVEQIDAGVWRADAQGVIVASIVNSNATLSIGFLGQDGRGVASPPAKSITLQGSGAAQAFAPAGQLWASTGPVEALEDGAALSIVEGDHHRDFRLNVHASASGGALGKSK